jgi:hypothetical protein
MLTSVTRLAMTSDVDTAGADSQRQTVSEAGARAMTGSARDIAVSAEDLVEKEGTPNLDEGGIGRRSLLKNRNRAPAGDQLTELGVRWRWRRHTGELAATRG